MKFKYLNLIAFGPFSERRIDFPDDHTFHLVFGPNEAGKSTVLRALTDVLYGIPNNTRDNHSHSARNLRIGAALRHSNGRELEFVRRKGRTKTLLALDDSVLETSALAAYLGDIDRNMFELMFGLNHERLTEGGRSLLQSGGSLGESLFEAASGISGLRSLVNDLDSNARDLFKPMGTNPPVNSLTRQYKEALVKVNELSLAARSWTELEEDYERQSEQVKRIIQAMQELLQEKSKLERISRTLPLLSKRNEYVKQIRAMGDVPILPDTAREERLDAQKMLEEAEKTREKARNKIEELETKKQGLDIPEGLLEQKDAILKLHEKLGLYRQYSAELPKVRGEISRLEQSVRDLLRELYPKEESLQNIEKYRPSVQQREAVKELANDYERLRERLQYAEDEVKQKQSAIEENEARRKKIGPLQDPKELRRCIKRAQKKGTLSEALDNSRKKAEKLEKQLSKDLRKLSPWEGTIEALEALPVPFPETIEQFSERMDEVKRKIDDVERRIEEVKEATADDHQRLQEIESCGDVPSEAELAAVRQRRDDGWALIRRAWIDGDPDREAEQQYDPEKPLHEAYEEALSEADETADIMRRDSEKVATKAQLVFRIQANTTKLESLGEEKATWVAELEKITNEWVEAWAPANITPLSPKEMQSWLVRYEKVMGQIAELREVQSYIASLEREIAEHRTEIGKALADLGQPVGESEPLDSLIMRGEELCSCTDKALGTLEGIKEEAEKLEIQLKAAEETKEERKEELRKWEARWSEAMRWFTLPEDTMPKVAQAFVEKLGQLFDQYEQLKQDQISEGEMQDYIDSFDAEAAELVSQLSLSFPDLTPDRIVSELNRRSEAASSDMATLLEINKQIESERDVLREAENRIAEANQELDRLMARARCSDVAALEKAEKQSEALINLQKSVEQLNEQLLEHGAGLSMDEIVSEAQGIDPDTLPGRIEEVDRQYNALDAERSQLEQRFGATKKEYEDKVQGSSMAAADAAEDAQSILAQLESTTAQYIRIRLAVSVLHRAIEKYREENQNPVVKRAGEIFARLTLGSFSSLKVDYDDKDNPVLLGVRPTGDSVGVEGMSDGTQDQLYLSLRLASIERYVQEAEPVPLIVDDILVNFDDERSRETLRVLAEISRLTQVIFFSHHRSLVELANQEIPKNILAVHNL